MSTTALQDLAQRIERAAFIFQNEAELQPEIGRLLKESRIPHMREVRLFDPSGRLDFLTDDGIAIEVKVDGSTNDLARQVMRYTQHIAVKAVLIVTTRSKHRTLAVSAFPKPVQVLQLIRSGL